MHSSYAQEEFAPVGAKWTHLGNLWLSGPPVLYQIECTQEEMVNGVLCKRLEGDFFVAASPFHIYQDGYKIFYFHPRDSLFHLLFDFDTEVGESWEVGGLPTGASFESHTVHVDSITWDVNNGDSLKILHTPFANGGYEWSEKKIVNIGSTSWFLPKFGLADFQSSLGPLVCYEDPNKSYSFVDVPCEDIIISNNNFSSSDVLVYPNPATDAIIFENLQDIKSIQISNVSGMLLHEFKPNTSTIQWDISQISDAVLIVKFTDDSNAISIQKVLNY